MSKLTYTFKGIQYEILSEITDKDDEGRANQLLRDFHWCEEKKDWVTIKNRINNGLLWGWLKEIEKDEQGFW